MCQCVENFCQCRKNLKENQHHPKTTTTQQIKTILCAKLVRFSRKGSVNQIVKE